jgi:transposase
MMTQEEYVDAVLAGRRQGKTMKEIAEELGYHPATVSKWLKRDGPPPARGLAPAEKVIDERWAARLLELSKATEHKLLATSGFAIIRAEGFDGSYPSVARYLRDLRGPRFRAPATVSMPIETAPGEEGQFDWSDCSAWTSRWGLGDIQCFELVLCWSRYKTWWFTSSLDAEHTFEGLVAAYEEVGGVPKVSRTDRMGALGHSQGRRFRLHPPAIEFARWHGTELKACQARDAKRKGKCERPFRDLKETFLTELDALGPPSSVAELNNLGRAHLAERVHPRPHSTTGEAPITRLAVEREFLLSLPRRRFDTAYKEDRRVHPRLALVSWEGVAYSVPPELVGSKVTCRVEVDSGTLEIWWGGSIARRHCLSPGATEPVWHASDRSAAEAIALGRSRLPELSAAQLAEPPAPSSPRLGLGEGDYDVEALDLRARYGGCGCTGREES